jgi:hypothetical protein
MSKSLMLSGLFLWLGPFVCTPLWGAPLIPCVDGNTAGYLCVTPPSPIGVLEVQGGTIPWFPFTVTNYTTNTLILDLAAWIITPRGPDTSDIVYFESPDVVPGVFSTYLTPIGTAGDTGVFNWPMYMPNPGGCDLAGCDFGLNTVSFAILMSVAVPGTLPPAPTASTGAPPVWITLTDPFTGAPIWGRSTVTGSIFTVSSVTVYDAPEPSSALMLGPVLALLGYAWRRCHLR